MYGFIDVTSLLELGSVHRFARDGTGFLERILLGRSQNELSSFRVRLQKVYYNTATMQYVKQMILALFLK